MRLKIGLEARHELLFAEQGLTPIAGVDEAGRGPLAGPVCAAAVILDCNRLPHGLRDSKLLSAKQRDHIFEDIIDSAIGYGIGCASAREIDRLNIRVATHLAMQRAAIRLRLKPAFVLIDGIEIPDSFPFEAMCMIDGDALCASIAAASIVAKVTRDRLMNKLCDRYPVYGFSRHAGYGTKLHLDAIRKYGPSPHHRMSFAPLKHLHKNHV